ncbi:MAG: phosphatase PAP2 family protein [Lachnospiraceae bacterium]|nr:phosphatase PAP2 family protein [Lachnospiraceae bacterium]
MRKLFRLIPPYAWACLGVMLLFQLLAYTGTKPLVSSLAKHDFSLAADKNLPFLPGWIIIYLLSYAYWLFGGLAVLKGDKAFSYRFAFSYCLSMLASGIVFLTIPVTIERPEVSGKDLLSALVRWLYRMDEPTNLFPSLHVMISWYCTRGLFHAEKLPLFIRWLSFFFTVLVCFSILFVKQHLILDIPSAILIAELSLLFSRLVKGERVGFFLEKRLKKQAPDGTEKTSLSLDGGSDYEQ